MKAKVKEELVEQGYKKGDIESAIVKPIFRTSTNYRRFPKVIPELDKTRITESAGYITAKQRIENMILAGQRLVDYRKEQFDFQPDEEIDPDFTDPTRSKNFDMADATQMGMAADARLQDQKQAADQKKLDQEKAYKEGKRSEEEKPKDDKKEDSK